MAFPGGERGEGTPFDLEDDAAAGVEQLSLTNPDDHLPWLESADDDGEQGVDSGRIVAFALVGMLAVVALVGALWWFTRDRPDPAMIADGSTIEAPPEGFKSRPADKGGEEVAGTGDTSFEVAEGRSVEGRIAGEGSDQVASATPGIDRQQGAGAASAATVPLAAPAPAAGGVGVQVGAFSSKEKAEVAWQQLQGRLPPLQGRSHRVVQGTADSGAIFRLQAVAGSVGEAETLCRSLRAAGGDCQVKR